MHVLMGSILASQPITTMLYQNRKNHSNHWLEKCKKGILSSNECNYCCFL